MQRLPSIFLALTTLLILTTTVDSKLNKDNVVFAVNCGGNEYESEDTGIVFQKVF